MFDRNAFRVIVAGGGTGGVTVFYGEQLNHTDAEIVYLDFSRTSMKISQRRARIRKIENIIWIHSWFEAVRYLGIGLFEQSECSGVLHHLKSPNFGLNILKDILMVNGGMNLMVYANLGRIAVYQVQHIQRLLTLRSDVGILKELTFANHTLNVLPLDHWFYKRSRIRDHKLGHADIYDLLLHKRDVAFSISELWQWIITGGLTFVDFDFFKTRFRFNIKYYNLDEHLQYKISLQSRLKILSTLENLLSNMMKYGCFVSKDALSEAKLRNPLNRIFLWGNPVGFRNAFLNTRNRKLLRRKTIFVGTLTSTYLPAFSNYSRMQTSIMKDADVNFAVELNPFIEFLMLGISTYLQGTSLKALFLEYKKVSNTTSSNRQLYALVQIFYDSIKDTELLLIKDASVLSFPKSSKVTLYKVT